MIACPKVPPPPFNIALGVLLCLMGLTSSASPVKLTSSSPPCLAAQRPVKLGPVASYLTDETKKEIQSYRERWRALCKKPGTEVNLGDFFASFQKLSEGINQVEAKVYRPGEETKWNGVVEFINREFTRFIPLLDNCGGMGDVGFRCEANFSQFNHYAGHGNSNDRRFFAEFSLLKGESAMAPWYEQTWDYGGCLRFGEYDWAATLKKMAELKKELPHPAYQAALDKLIGEFFAALFGSMATDEEDLGKYCACKSKESVLPDLTFLLTFLQSSQDFPAETKKAVRVVKALREKKIQVSSQAEAHCSGG